MAPHRRDFSQDGAVVAAPEHPPAPLTSSWSNDDLDLDMSDGAVHKVSSVPSSPTRSVPVKGRMGRVATSKSPTSSKTNLLLHRQSTHLLEDRDKLLACIRLLDAGKFSSLPRPFSREQDLLPEYFGMPSANDQVISVSHAWRNQAHPDPTCNKMRILERVLTDNKVSGPQNQHILLFLDFMCIPQRPFRSDQAPRTEEELLRFHTALSCMHEMYFYSDRIIHLPWDESKVEGEGVEVVVSATDLQDAKFAQMGNVVQISALGSREDSQHNTAGPELFDHVVAVDNELVTSLEQLESLLDTCTGMVRLRHYPMGVVSNIPAYDRGWIFLERFITMVKCAMMDQETARSVVITPEDAIMQEIMQGANKLREAALKDLNDGSSGELKKVLGEFTRELETKRFSPASTDRREMELEQTTSIKSDREVVLHLMRHFAEHIASHWEIEAVRQRSVARRLSAALEATRKFALDWDCFSEAYAAKLELASTAHPWPVLVQFVSTLALSLWFVLLPYETPNEGGWRSQTTFWVFACPLWVSICSSSGAFWFRATADIRLAPHGLRLFISLAVVFMFVGIGLYIGISAALDTFPVPMNLFLTVPLMGTTTPLLWFCIAKDQRACIAFRWRLVYSFVGIASILGIFATVFPLLNAAIALASTNVQAMLVLAYLSAKLGFEFVGVQVSKRLGADVMPYFIFMATACYQINLCVAFSKVHSWWLVVQQVTFDVAENFYHLYSILRQQRKEGTARQEQYIVASLVLREYLELSIPVQFLIMTKLVQKFRPEFSEILCQTNSEESQELEAFLGVDIGVEILVSFFTYLVLRRRGHLPLKLLRGLIATRLGNLLVLGTCVPFFVVMQHTHWGMDLSFEWPWVFEDDPKWQCGLTWLSAAK